MQKKESDITRLNTKKLLFYISLFMICYGLTMSSSAGGIGAISEKELGLKNDYEPHLLCEPDIDEKDIYTEGANMVDLISEKIEEFRGWSSEKICDFKLLNSYVSGLPTYALFEIEVDDNNFGHMIYNIQLHGADIFMAQKSPYRLLFENKYVMESKLNIGMSENIYLMYSTLSYGIAYTYNNELVTCDVYELLDDSKSVYTKVIDTDLFTPNETSLFREKTKMKRRLFSRNCGRIDMIN